MAWHWRVAMYRLRWTKAFLNWYMRQLAAILAAATSLLRSWAARRARTPLHAACTPHTIICTNCSSISKIYNDA